MLQVPRDGASDYVSLFASFNQKITNKNMKILDFIVSSLVLLPVGLKNAAI
jgi:hypothetical protein